MAWPSSRTSGNRGHQAVFTVTEQRVSIATPGDRQAQPFVDSVGVGCWHSIDLHPSTGGDNYLDLDTHPFLIPVGALLPIRVENVLPACKNLGVTPFTNGCYREHAVEWSIGEIAGLAGRPLPRSQAHVTRGPGPLRPAERVPTSSCGTRASSLPGRASERCIEPS
jgi:FAD dependent oxidoreductase